MTARQRPSFYRRFTYATRTLRNSPNPLILGLLLAGLYLSPLMAQPSWYDGGSNSGIQPGSPDFYQHQIQETGFNGGFCDFFAYEDAMYFDSTIGFPNLYANNPDWVNGMVTNFLNILATDVGPQFSYMRNY